MHHNSLRNLTIVSLRTSFLSLSPSLQIFFFSAGYFYRRFPISCSHHVTRLFWLHTSQWIDINKESRKVLSQPLLWTEFRFCMHVKYFRQFSYPQRQITWISNLFVLRSVPNNCFGDKRSYLFGIIRLCKMWPTKSHVDVG